ncbi:cation:proton antiporter domain-containing protein [Catenuloplanes japonicus]|uniref:cation:proton antiporter domain-containing protein n=1 Tax=Catenuloplanes japonicus TaxID=33876 RepID=UPI00068EA8B2|nr:cation:proton antiporter [Catenuloplanes japonicus]
MLAAELTVAGDRNLELVLKVLPAIVVILAASALCGRLAIALRQPRVLGEMVAGVLLGPTLFGALAPGLQQTIFPAEVKPVLYVLSTLGLTLFMFLVGADFDHGADGNGARDARHATVLALSGMIPALLLGAGAALVLYDRLSRPDVGRLEFALFLGGALSITAFPMLARILYERGLQYTRLGRLSLLGASIDDAAAWCFLAVLLALHSGTGTGHALRTLAMAGGFALVMLTVVARLLRPLGRRVQQTGKLGYDGLYLVLIVVVAAGFATDLIGIYSVFGGFIAGLAMPKTAAFRKALHDRMMDLVSVLLLPTFFTFSGLNTHLGGLAGGAALLQFGLILLAGFLGKYVGCALALRTIRFSWRESFAVGSLMNARGLMILIFINIGLAQNLITPDVFSMLVMVAVITTAAAMPLYRLSMPPALEARMTMPSAPSTPSSSLPSGAAERPAAEPVAATG